MIYIILCLAISAIFRSGLYLHTWKYDRSIFFTKNPYAFSGKQSWVRKYKRKITNDGQRIEISGPPDTWYYRFFNLDYKEQFPLFGTALVFVTDLPHFVQFVFLTFIAAAVTIAGDLPWYYILIFKSIMSSTFQMFFGKFFTRKFWGK